jgi:hypothetical protein
MTACTRAEMSIPALPGVDAVGTIASTVSRLNLMSAILLGMLWGVCGWYGYDFKLFYYINRARRVLRLILYRRRAIPILFLRVRFLRPPPPSPLVVRLVSQVIPIDGAPLGGASVPIVQWSLIKLLIVDVLCFGGMDAASLHAISISDRCIR